MRMIREWIHRFAGALRTGRRDRDLAEELQLHLELAAEEAQRQGHGPDEALRLARMRVGGDAPAMEALRDQRGIPALTGLGQDLRLGLRSLGTTPLATSVAILSLALAIGANTAIFSIANSLLLRSLPVHDPGRLVHVTDSVLRDTGETRIRAWSNPVWEQIQKRADLFEAATAWSIVRFNLAAAAGGESRPVDGLWADGGFFDTLGVTAIHGRTFSRADDQRGGGPSGPVTVISYGYWQRQFGGALDVIGRSVPLNGVPFTIVGVTPPDFFGLEVGRTFDVIAPLRTEALGSASDSMLDSAASNYLSVVARLKRGQSPDAAAAELRRVQHEIRAATLGPWDKETRDRYLTSRFTVVPAATGYSDLRQNYRAALFIVGVVVALVLLIGCVNVANLLLARASARGHQLSVQVALGASRWRLARQLLAESFLLSTTAAALGAFIAAFGSRFLVDQLSTPTTAVFLDLTIDGRILGFTTGIAVATALLFGTAPALWAARTQPTDVLKEKGRSSPPGKSMASLVSLQVALSLVLVVGAGLFIRSFAALAGRDLGFEPERILVAAVYAQRTNVASTERVALYERAREAVLGLPNVASAAISHLTPVGGGGFTPAIEVSTPAGPKRVDPNGDVFGNVISPGWFGTFGTPLRAGRDFTDADRKGAPRVAIVNETFARTLLGDLSPIGRTLTIYPNTPRALQAQIVGVAADAVYSSPREPAPATWYVPIAQFDVPGFPFASARLSVRGNGVPALMTKSVEAAIMAVNPQLMLTFRSLSDQVDASLTRERLLAQLAGFFGVVALLLAGLGLYGVTAYVISTRRIEIGIRLALGAAPQGVVSFVLARVAMMVAAGLVVGVIVSLWTASFVSGLLYRLPPRDPATLIAAVGVLFAVGAIAGWIPARRAARIDPGAVLRRI